MITPINELLINDNTELSRSKLMKSTIILDSGKRQQIENNIMRAGNDVNRRVHTLIATHVRPTVSIKGEK